MNRKLAIGMGFLCISQTAFAQCNGVMWHARLYSQNTDYLEIGIDTKQINPSAYLTDVALTVDIQGPGNQLLGTPQFSVPSQERGFRQGFYVYYPIHAYQNATSALGRELSYMCVLEGAQPSRTKPPARQKGMLQSGWTQPTDASVLGGRPLETAQPTTTQPEPGTPAGPGRGTAGAGGPYSNPSPQPNTSSPSPPQQGGVACASLRLLQPEHGAVLPQRRIGSTTVQQTWRFAWKDCPEAERYHLYVIHPKAQNPLVDATNLRSAFYEYAGISHSSYGVSYLHGWTWKVRAMVNGQWSAWSEQREFSAAPVH